MYCDVLRIDFFAINTIPEFLGMMVIEAVFKNQVCFFNACKNGKKIVLYARCNKKITFRNIFKKNIEIIMAETNQRYV